MKAHRIAAVTALLFLLYGLTCGAQDFPNRPVRIIVANAPGAGPDLVARLIGPVMAESLGQAIVVENKPGANNIVGYEFVAKQPANGYTVGMISVSGLAILPVTVKDLRFDPLTDLVPVANLVDARFIFGSSSELPWKTFAELVTNARANPGKLNYGSPAPNVRLPTEVLVRRLGLNVVAVPYSGSNQYFLGLMTRDVHMGFVSEGALGTFGDKFRVLAVTGATRHAKFPNVPTFTELGFAQIPGITNSLNVRAATPRPIIDRLHAAAMLALRQPAVRTRLAQMQYDILDQSPEEAAKGLADLGKFFAETARQIGLQPE